MQDSIKYLVIHVLVVLFLNGLVVSSRSYQRRVVLGSNPNRREENMLNSPINVNSDGESGIRGKGWEFQNNYKLLMKLTGWGNKRQSKVLVSNKPHPGHRSCAK